MLTLVCTNVLTFLPHYRGSAQFPWDFPMSYYGFVAYWTTAIRHHVTPEWMPFQEMGYPFFANLQTGIAYPPFWVFPAFDIDYTMQAAVIVEVLHVLWGSLGAYALGRLLFGRGAPALLLGVGFHFFGGFYANAQHTDIIRSFAWLPWLFFAAHLAPGQKRLALRNCALALVVALSISGGYPGNVASHLLLLGISIVVSFLPPTRPPLRLLGALLGMMVLGIVLCAPMLGPGLALKDSLVRSTGVRPEEMGWPLTNWPYLVLPWRFDWTAQDPSMAAAFLPLPVLVLVTMLRRETLRSVVPWVSTLVVTLAMMPGHASRIARIAYRVFPVLGLSRFPSSDYRAAFALALLVLGAASLHALLDARTHTSAAFVRSRLFVSFALFFLLLTGQGGFRIFWIDLAVVFVALSATVALLAKVVRGGRLAAYGLVVIALLHGTVVTQMVRQSWQTTSTRGRYMRALGFYPGSDLPVEDRLDHPLTARPARHDTPDLLAFSWRGYLAGSYEIRDTTAPTYLGGSRILRDPLLASFMAEPWRALVLAPAPIGGGSEVAACDAFEARLREGVVPSEAESVRYGVNDEVFSVDRDTTALLVENETYFPGWEARLVRDGREIGRVTPSPICEGVRAWSLPAGRYEVHARYVTPRLATSLRIAGAASALYLLALLAIGWSRLREARGASAS